ncbi:hypothetical protein BH24ACT21_BH24ACT21_03220 [soil metagenome]
MSPETIAAGGLSEASEPRSTPYDGGTLSIRYRMAETSHAFSLTIPKKPPEHLLLDVEMAVEDAGVFLRAVQVDVAVEEDTSIMAFGSLIRAVMGWLNFLAEEQPKLAPELEAQQRYTELLNYDPATWFGRAFMAE